MEATFADLVGDENKADVHAEMAVIKPDGALVVAPAPTLRQVVLAQFVETETKVVALTDKYRNVAFDVGTTKGLAQAKAARLELREEGRFFLQRAETRTKFEVNDLKKVMGAEVDRLVAIIKPVEDAIDSQIKAREEVLAAEKAERDRIEAERVAKHRAGIEKLQGYLGRAAGASSAAIQTGIQVLSGMVFDKAKWEEFAAQAQAARDTTILGLQALLPEAVAREDREAAAERQRVENERIAAELAQQKAALAEERRLFAEQQASIRRELAAQEAAAKRPEVVAAATLKADAPEEKAAQAVTRAPRAAAVPQISVPSATPAHAETLRLAGKYGIAMEESVNQLWCFDLSRLAALIDDVRAAA